MTALIDLFRNLASILDALVIKVDGDLPLAEDIHPAIRKVGEYAADMLRLPGELAALEAVLASVQASVPARDAAVRKARHEAATLEAKLKKLRERIDYNRSVLTPEDEKPVTRSASPVPGLALKSRVDIIEDLRTEIIAEEEKLAAAHAVLKRAEAFRKGVGTRMTNLAGKIGAARKAISDHEGRLEETVKLLRKTIARLKARQEKRDRKRSAAGNVAGAVIQIVDACPQPAAPNAPTDEDIRTMAASYGLDIESPDDLEAARQLFLN